MSTTPKVGLFAPLESKSDKATEVKSFLEAGPGLLEAEPLTIQWYAFKYDTPEPKYAVFDAFAGEEGRDAHLNGKVAEALMANAPNLLSTLPEIKKFEIICSKIVKTDVKFGLFLLGEARSEKVDALIEFSKYCLDLMLKEQTTPQWYAVRFYDENGPTNQFGFFDFMETAEYRDVHLEGETATAFLGRAEELFSEMNVIKFEVVASRIL